MSDLSLLDNTDEVLKNVYSADYENKEELWGRLVSAFREKYQLTQKESSEVLDIAFYTQVGYEQHKRVPFRDNAHDIVHSMNVFPRILKLVLEGRIKTLYGVTPQEYMKKVDEYEFYKTCTELTPLDDKNRKALVEICKISHKYFSSLDNVLEFLKQYYAFAEDLSGKLGKDKPGEFMNQAYKAFLKNVDLQHLIPVFSAWAERKEKFERFGSKDDKNNYDAGIDFQKMFSE